MDINGRQSMVGEKRKSRLRYPIEIPKIRNVEFKYHDKIETLPVNCNLTVKYMLRQSEDEASKLAESAESKSGKSKSKNRPRKKAPTDVCQLSTATAAAVELKLPEARFRVVKQASEKYKEPRLVGAYQRFLEDDGDEQSKVEYDMDEEDEIWLVIMNKKRRLERLPDVSADILERTLDRLEKESFFQSQYQGSDAGPAIDEDAVCCICFDGECFNSNAILFCDMCNLAVHQECYGVPYIPEGQWLCRRCMHSPSVTVDCILCPNKGGAFKQTDDNRWAHVICALWIPEVCFANTVFLEPIDSISAIPPARWKLNCCVCNQKNVGACIQCHKSNCYSAFHVTCAQQAGLSMKMEFIDGIAHKMAYCFTHMPTKNGGRSNGPNSSGDEDGKGVHGNQEKRKKHLADKRSSCPIVSIPTIPISRLSQIYNSLPESHKCHEFLVRLYEYWKLKRKSRNGAPLLRRLQNNTIIRQDLLHKESPRRLRDHKSKLDTIRTNLESVRLLWEQIKKREKVKTMLLNHSRQYHLYRLQPFKVFLLTILDKVVEKDIKQFFLEPVSTEDVPDYLIHIKEPMDLGTMRKKVEQNQYRSFEAFEYDLNLIISNCKFYNEKETIFHKVALKLEPFIRNFIEEHRPLALNYDQETGLHKDLFETTLPTTKVLE